MKTNLLFKRQETINGVTQVVTRVVPVDIPGIESGEGWILTGHSDIIEYTPEPTNSVAEPTARKTKETKKTSKKSEDSTDMIKFISNVSGTAKLVRTGSAIKIVARRGKTTYNQTAPNSVCINDFTKTEFFKNCRQRHGEGAGIYEFTMRDGTYYDYWNKVIDEEYQRQRKDYEKSQGILK